jgi:HEAT repeat protein
MLRSWEVRAQAETEAARQDPRSTHELISQALTLDEEDSLLGEILTLLHFRATREVFEAAAALCKSRRTAERQLGASILNQLGHPDRIFPDEVLAVLSAMLVTEKDRDVLHTICIALRYLDLPEGIPLLLSLKEHPDAWVRHGVAFGLGGEEDPEAVQGLIDLSADEDEVVRDWATFGLGKQLDLDTPPIRAALAARLDDPDPVTRAEAFGGLARRKDPRVIPPLLEALRPERIDWFEEGQDLVIEAAEELADPRLRVALRRLRASRQEG